MTSTTLDTARIDVPSADGTRLAVFVSGTGRPLVLVPGTTSDHTTWRLVTPLLNRKVAVWAVDRRGRGASGDHPDYTLAKEYDDVAAVVDRAAAEYGGPVDLLGHSYGGNVSFGAATRTSNLRRLVLYEGWPTPDLADRTVDPDRLAEMDRLLEQGRPEEMLLEFYRHVMKGSEEDIALMRSAPTWPARVAAAPTVPRECRAFGSQAFDPATAARVGVPVLLLVGSDSPRDIKADPDVVAAALPDARIHELPGQQHVAQLTAPELLARVVLEFLR